MKIYSDSSNEFMLLDYSRSHSQLLIRSKRNKTREYNIDIIFKGVLVLFIPERSNGIDISLFKLNNENSFLTNDYGFKQNKDYKIFVLENSEGQKYYINAGCFGIYHNKLDILETSIGRYDMENFGENILWYAD